MQEHAAYVRADVQLERLNPTAEATVTQYFLTVQTDLKEAAARELTAARKRVDPLQSHRA